MSEQTAISWTDHTFNPWWGCVRVSPGCEHCYAETFAKRTGHAVWGPVQTTGRRLFGAPHWAEPLKWERQAVAEGRQHRVFCASMADVFEDHPQVDGARERLWDLIAVTPHLDWQLLTKRPENVQWMVPREWMTYRTGFPRNIWLGVTVENQFYAEQRITPLMYLPAHVRFLSCEPLLDAIDLKPWMVWVDGRWRSDIHWVICGGESGPHHRPLDLAWARSLQDQCAAAGIAFWFKQAGGLYPGRGADALGAIYHEFPQPAVPA